MKVGLWPEAIPLRQGADTASRRHRSTVEALKATHEVRSVRCVIRIAFDAGRLLQAAAGRCSFLDYDVPCKQLCDAGLGSFPALGVGRRERARHARGGSGIRSCGDADAIVGAGSGVCRKRTLERRLARNVSGHCAVLVIQANASRRVERLLDSG